MTKKISQVIGSIRYYFGYCCPVPVKTNFIFKLFLYSKITFLILWRY